MKKPPSPSVCSSTCMTSQMKLKRKKICVKAELRKGGCYQKSQIKGELISSAEQQQQQKST